MTDIVLQSGAWQARLLPEAGGLIAALTCGDVPILRTMPPGATDPLVAACFPMVPWCNRIGAGRFGWEGRVVALAPNFPPERHAIHGHGWQSQWQVGSRTPEACMLLHRHDGAAPGWPWAYEARQTVALTDTGCRITLSLTNGSDRLMPSGIGLHPYLRRRPESRVTFSAENVVDVGGDMLPTGTMRPADHFADFARGALLPEALIDHCFTGWAGHAHVHDDLGTITLFAEGAEQLHLYAPEAPDILCLEPVNHAPDAANTGAMPLCAPGETISLTLRIAAT